MPPDDVIEAMDKIGKMLPSSLRETSQAGLAMTEEGQRISARLARNRAMFTK